MPSLPEERTQPHPEDSTRPSCRYCGNDADEIAHPDPCRRRDEKSLKAGERPALGALLFEGQFDHEWEVSELDTLEIYRIEDSERNENQNEKRNTEPVSSRKRNVEERTPQEVEKEIENFHRDNLLSLQSTTDCLFISINIGRRYVFS